MNTNDMISKIKEVVGLSEEVKLEQQTLENGAILEAESFEADRKSTRLNSSHGYISYAVFCWKKKNKNK